MKITTYNQLKKLHGKRVTCVLNGTKITDGKISVNSKGVKDIYICQNEETNDSQYCEEYFGYKYPWFVSKTGFNEIRDLHTVEKTLETLEEGDVLVDEEGDERTVLEVSGRIIFTTWCNSEESTGVSTWSIKQLDRDGWKLKNTSSEEMVELTLQEIADLKGISVEQLRIKEEK